MLCADAFLDPNLTDRTGRLSATLSADNDADRRAGGSALCRVRKHSWLLRQAAALSLLRRHRSASAHRAPPARGAPRRRSWWTEGLDGRAGGPRHDADRRVTNCPRAGAVEIFDGRIDGDTVRFSCRSQDGRSTIAFTGKLNGDQITFTWDLREPVPVAPPGRHRREAVPHYGQASTGLRRPTGHGPPRRADSDDASAVHSRDVRPDPARRSGASELAHLLRNRARVGVTAG